MYYLFLRIAQSNHKHTVFAANQFTIVLHTEKTVFLERKLLASGQLSVTVVTLEAGKVIDELTGPPPPICDLTLAVRAIYGLHVELLKLPRNA